MKKSFNVDSTFNDMRIDRWIRNNLGNYPQSLIEKSLKSGKIKINTKKVKSSHKVNEDSEPTLDHIAFKAKNIINVKKHLQNNAIPYEEKITPDNKISQIFIKDPNGIKIELSKSL